MVELLVNNMMIVLFIGVIFAIERPSLAMFKKSGN